MPSDSLGSNELPLKFSCAEVPEQTKRESGCMQIRFHRCDMQRDNAIVRFESDNHRTVHKKVETVLVDPARALPDLDRFLPFRMKAIVHELRDERSGIPLFDEARP